MLGICNGFQALIKLGLVPYGKIIDTDENSPTLTFNSISRHQSKIVATKIVSNNSPWLKGVNVGDIRYVPISHGEGRFIATEEMLKTLKENGQIARLQVIFNLIQTTLTMQLKVFYLQTVEFLVKWDIVKGIVTAYTKTFTVITILNFLNRQLNILNNKKRVKLWLF